MSLRLRSRPLRLLLVLTSGCAVGGLQDADGSHEERSVLSAASVAATPAEMASAAHVAPRADGFAPTSVDLRAHFGAARSQGGRGTCLAFTTTAMVEFFANKASGSADADFSEQGLFYDALVSEDGFRPGQDGTLARYYANAVTGHGVLRESAWPYESRSWLAREELGCDVYAEAREDVLCYTNGEPPEASRDDARARLVDYEMIVATTENLRNHLATAGTPVAVGFYYYDEAWRDDGIVASHRVTTDGDTAAAHAVVIVGYDDEKTATVEFTDADGTTSSVERTGFFLIRNSWGGLWGERGYGWVSYEYTAANLVRAEVSTGLAE